MNKETPKVTLKNQQQPQSLQFSDLKNKFLKGQIKENVNAETLKRKSLLQRKILGHRKINSTNIQFNNHLIKQNEELSTKVQKLEHS